MAKRTPNFNLVTIELDDSPPDITVLNENFEILDKELNTVGGFVLMDESIPITSRIESKLYAMKRRTY